MIAQSRKQLSNEFYVLLSKANFPKENPLKFDMDLHSRNFQGWFDAICQYLPYREKGFCIGKGAYGGRNSKQGDKK